MRSSSAFVSKSETVASGLGGSTVRSSGGAICTCSECETCAREVKEVVTARTARKETAANETVRSRATTHPQVLCVFWHSLGGPAKISAAAETPKPLSESRMANAESPSSNAVQAAHCLLV